MPVYPDVISTVGRTPLIKLNRITNGAVATIALKGEFFNPLGSVKDRIGYAMIAAAEREGILTPKHHDHRADLGQHRDRAGVRGGGQGLQAHPDHAGEHERGAAHSAGAAGGQAGPHPGHRGHERGDAEGRGPAQGDRRLLDSAAVR